MTKAERHEHRVRLVEERDRVWALKAQRARIDADIARLDADRLTRNESLRRAQLAVERSEGEPSGTQELPREADDSVCDGDRPQRIVSPPHGEERRAIEYEMVGGIRAVACYVPGHPRPWFVLDPVRAYEHAAQLMAVDEHMERILALRTRPFHPIAVKRGPAWELVRESLRAAVQNFGGIVPPDSLSLDGFVDSILRTMTPPADLPGVPA
jgi:hypothetical protein